MKNYFLLLFGLLVTATLFSQKEEAVTLTTKEGYTICGTLTSPEDQDASSVPLVILIAGSGPTDRNGNNSLMQNNSLKMLSALLSENGYACLRYDKRSIAESKIENFDTRTLSFDDFLADASGWVDKYAEQYSKVILAGHSQGSLVAFLTANQNDKVTAVISLAGAGRPIHEILKTQLAASLSVEMQGLVNAKLDTLAMGDTLQYTPDMFYSLMHPTVQPFLISWMKYAPTEEIARLKIPVLIINGTTDIQVAVSEAKLLAASNEKAKLVIIKNMNHILKFIRLTDQSSQLEVYGDPNIPLHKKFPSAILKFLDSLE
ncbi:MAG: alpha/beta hydrolase [Crocinitomicaceae bacterium]